MSPPNKFDKANNEADNHAADEQRPKAGRQEREQGQHLRDQPDDPAQNRGEQLKDELNSNLKINGIILTQYDGRSNLSSDTQSELENYFASSLMATKIRQNVDLGKAPALAQDIFTFAPHSNGAKDYEFLALEILDREGLEINA